MGESCLVDAIYSTVGLFFLAADYYVVCNNFCSYCLYVNDIAFGMD